MKTRKILITLGASIGALLLVVGLAAAWTLRVEEIPDELDAIDAANDPRDLVIEGLNQPDLVVRELTGQTTFFLVEGPQSFRSREGQKLSRALNRWVFPDTTKGYIIGDLGGFGLFRKKIEETIGMFSAEMRFPVYPDFDGQVLEAFALPVGHTAFIVLGNDGEIVTRHTGAPTPEEIQTFRKLLGATEPPPGPPAPTFFAGSLNNESCAGKICVVAFLGVPMTRADVPGVEGGREIKEEEAMEAMKQPELRLVSTLTRFEMPKDTPAAFVGSLTGMDEEMKGWEMVPDSAQVREPFGVEEGQTAFFIIDAQGRLAFAETGNFPLYRTGRVAELLKVEMKRDDEDEGKADFLAKEEQDAPPS